MTNHVNMQMTTSDGILNVATDDDAIHFELAPDGADDAVLIQIPLHKFAMILNDLAKAGQLRLTIA